MAGGIAGIVLAGGRSTRWGSEKAVARVGGAPMVARVHAVLARGCERVAVNAPRGSGAWAWAERAHADLAPDAPGLPDGPLTGVLAGLAWAEARGAELLAVAPCDAPGLPADYVARLHEGLGAAPAAVAVTDSGGHPLCALVRTSLRPQLEATLAQGHPSVRRWLDEVGAVGVRFPDEKAFANLNTRPRGVGARLFDATLMALTGAALGLLLGGFVLALAGGGPPGGAATSGGAAGGGGPPLFLLLPLLALGFGGAGAGWGWLGRPPWSRA